MGKMKDWFSGLSKVGKTGVVAGGLILVGSVNSLASPGGTPTPTSTTPPAVQQSQVEVKTETTAEPIAFMSTTVDDANLPKGQTQLRTAGANGVLTKTYKVTYTNGGETDRSAAVEAVTTEPVAEVTAVGTYVPPAPAPAPQVNSNCDPNYSGGCVPLVSYDLNCPDIGFNVRVIGSDPHGFDGNDNDGLGCESY